MTGSDSPIFIERSYQQADALLCRTAPYNEAVLKAIGLDASKVTAVEFHPYDELYKMIIDHISSETNARSFVLDVGRKGSSDEDEDSDIVRTSSRSLGLGIFPFAFNGSEFHALHQTLGEVVGTDCGPRLLKSLVLLSPGPIEKTQSFVDSLLAKADATCERKFTIFRWNADYEHWRRVETATARNVNSVVLPASDKEKLVQDLDDFVSRGTRAWYAEHGIPYKRGYMLHGSPGAGKTSLIQAIAGRYKRNLAILTPSHPKMTDESLKAAVQRVPPKSIIVLEDVDAIFEGRTSSKSSLTFSGMLNALDGVGNGTGQIFILTTNHREKLDPALIRNGRVDVHVEFKPATEEQMAGLFGQFYKEASQELAQSFAKGLMDLLGDKESVSMAQLQHYFIMQRKATPEEAAAQFAKVVEAANAHGNRKMEEKATEAEATEAEAKDDKAEGKGKGGKGKVQGDGEEAEKNSDTGKATHVHVHLH
jgi:chaperone BCS1